MERMGELAYKLELPEGLSGVHDVFHVSQLKKCHAEMAEKHGTHRELPTILREIPTCKQLHPYAPILGMVLQIVVLTSL